MTGWAVAFWAVAALVAACALSLMRFRLRARRRPAASPAPAQGCGCGQPEAGCRLDRRSQRALWIVLALVPSALLLGVTQHLATDVVSAPLLWVVPLALYLATFIAAFSTSPGASSAARAARGGRRARRVGRALLVLVLSLAEVRYPMLLVTLVHLAAFTVLAMLCHTRLAESRPDADASDGVLRVRLARRRAGRGGGGARRAGRVLLDSRVSARDRRGTLSPAAEASRRTAWRHRRARRLAWRAGAAVLLVAGYWCVSALNEHADFDAALDQRLVRLAAVAHRRT